MLETDACAAGEQTKLVSVDVTAQSSILSFGPAQSRMNEQSNKSSFEFDFWNEREIMIGISIMPTENLWPEFFHRTCSFF